MFIVNFSVFQFKTMCCFRYRTRHASRTQRKMRVSFLCVNSLRSLWSVLVKQQDTISGTVCETNFD